MANTPPLRHRRFRGPIPARRIDGALRCEVRWTKTGMAHPDGSKDGEQAARQVPPGSEYRRASVLRATPTGLRETDGDRERASISGPSAASPGSGAAVVTAALCGRRA